MTTNFILVECEYEDTWEAKDGRVIENCVEPYWAVREPQFRSTVNGKPTAFTADPAPWLLFGGQPIRVHDHSDIAGLRALLDEIESDLKETA